MKIPEGLLYHPEHTWAKVEGGVAVVGITDFAQDELGTIVFVEFPEVGAEVAKGKVFGTIESSKSVSELHSPVDGVVAEVNNKLEDSPEVINDDPYGAGWIIKVTLQAGFDAAGLIGAEAYRHRTEV